MITYNLNLDDCIPAFKGFDMLDRLIAEYPAIKITLFVSMDSHVAPNCNLEEAPVWCGRLLSYSPANVELAYHGYHHTAPNGHGEFWDLTRKRANALLAQCEDMASRLGLPMTKGFRAPKWEVSEGTRRALEDRRYLYLADAPAYYAANSDIRIPRLFVNHDIGLGPLYRDGPHRNVAPDPNRYCIQRGHCVCRHPNELSPKSLAYILESLRALGPASFAFLSELVGRI